MYKNHTQNPKKPHMLMEIISGLRTWWHLCNFIWWTSLNSNV